MTTEQNKAVVRRFFEAFGANDQEALKEVLAPSKAAASSLSGHGGVSTHVISLKNRRKVASRRRPLLSRCYRLRGPAPGPSRAGSG